MEGPKGPGPDVKRRSPPPALTGDVLLLRLLVPACPAAHHLHKNRLAWRLAVLVGVQLRKNWTGGTQGRSQKAPVREPRVGSRLSARTGPSAPPWR